jgi:hypothetical protein
MESTVRLGDSPGGVYNIGAIYAQNVVVGSGSITTIVTPTPQGARVDEAAAPQLRRFTSGPPAPPARFLDREEALGAIVPQLRPRALIWLSYPFGAGATTLLRQVANLAGASQFPAGVVYLERRREPQHYADLVQSLLNRFVVDAEGRPLKWPLEAQEAELGQLRALFLLDQLALGNDELVRLADVLQRVGAVLVAAHGSPPKSLLPLSFGPLPGPDALALLRASSGVVLAGAEAPLAEELCAALDCLPLGMVLAGGLLADGQPLAGLVERARALPAERHPLRRVVRLSLATLGADALAALGALARGDVGPQELEQLCATAGLSLDAGEAALECLIRRELVVDSGQASFAVAGETLRQVLLRLLPDTGERQRAVTGLAAVAAARVGDPGWALGKSQDLLATARTALEQGQHASAGVLLRAAQPELVARGYWAGWNDAIVLAFEAAKGTGDQALRAWALHERGTRAGLLGDSRVAQASLETAERLRLELGDRAGAALSRHNRELFGFVPPPPGSPPGARDPVAPIGLPPRRGGWLPWLILPLLLVLLPLPFVFGNRLFGAGPPTALPSEVALVTPLAPTSLPPATLEPSATSTLEPSATSTLEPSATSTLEPSATSTPEPSATSTPEPSATPTPTPTVQIGFELPLYQILESDGQLMITLLLSEPSELPVTVEVETLPSANPDADAATLGKDYALRQSSVRFDTDGRGMLSIVMINDQEVERDETFRLRLANPVNATIAEDAGETEVVILDDDSIVE